MTAQLADLSEGDLLDEVGVLRRRQLETGVQILQLVAEFARQHGEDTVDPVQAKRPGRERAVPRAGCKHGGAPAAPGTALTEGRVGYAISGDPRFARSHKSGPVDGLEARMNLEGRAG